MQLGEAAEGVRQVAEQVVVRLQHGEGRTLAQLRRQRRELVAVQPQLAQGAQLADGGRQLVQLVPFQAELGKSRERGEHRSDARRANAVAA